MEQSKIGYIDSLETIGLVDGPGIRTVIFFNKCNLRCTHCYQEEYNNHMKKEDVVWHEEDESIVMEDTDGWKGLFCRRT